MEDRERQPVVAGVRDGRTAALVDDAAELEDLPS
jgi:hypothetical protein